MSALDDLLLKTYHESVAVPSALRGAGWAADREKGGADRQASNDMQDETKCESTTVYSTGWTSPPVLAAPEILNWDEILAANESQGGSNPSPAEAPEKDVDKPSDVESTASLEESPQADLAVASAGNSHVFKPQWEVDRFQWPEVCAEIDTALKSELEKLVEQLRPHGEDSPRAVAFVGDQPAAGRSTLALCVARRAAKLGLRVALVDLDGRQPTLAARLGVEVDAGFEAVLQGQRVEDVCVAAVEDGVVLLPSVSPISSPWQENVVQALGELLSAYDLVVIDTAATAALPPELSWPLSLILVKDGRATTGGTDLRQNLRNSQCCAGVIENFAA